MNGWDIAIIIVLAAAVAFAVVMVVRNKRRGKTCGCSECASCDQCSMKSCPGKERKT
ncbi:MAG: FeoB-associated Cys-rich membrane protein [Lachnospiraceae bacterium]|nr:FeoB-associated Cys-rich membrane protein [Lachnospiraceae bacterium]